MMDALLLHLDDALLAFFGLGALSGGVLMLVLREPMRVAMALVSTMVFLGGIYGLVGVHFIAAFQVLIYVGAVMVFMVYVIMLLDKRDSSMRRRYTRATVALGAVAAAGVLLLGLTAVVARAPAAMGKLRSTSFSLQDFATAFLREYWLQFELTSVLLLAAVVAAIALMKGSGESRG
jgi:NADH-quinone oxidoreductase subunit J